MDRRAVFLLLALTLAACARPAPPPRAAGSLVAKPHPVFADADPHEGIGAEPGRYPVHGIDVSRWQGAVDWRRVRAAGVSFAYIKATEGGDVLDPAFARYWQGAKAAGLRYGAYHYFYFCRPAEEQAAWFIRHVPRDPEALPPVLDMEWNAYSPTCRRRPEGAVVRAEARRFMDILERHYGRRPILYTTVDFFRDSGIGSLQGTQFWLRSVAAPPDVTFPGKGWLFWQYTGTGLVPGVSGPVDVNVFAGGLEDWAAFAR